MATRPSNREKTSTFTDTREEVSNCRPCRSQTTTSSITRRFRKPRSTLPTETFVPNFSSSARPASRPTKPLIAGMCSNTTSAKYSPAKVHTAALIICLSLFSLSSLMKLRCKLTQKILKSGPVARKKLEPRPAKHNGENARYTRGFISICGADNVGLRWPIDCKPH